MMTLFQPPEEAQCPNCLGKNVRNLSVQLPIARLLSSAARGLVHLRLHCRKCQSEFRHLHALPRTVIGYHGCHQQFARDLLAKRISLDEWKASGNSYDWLGAGIYFWEHAPGRAWQWAREHYAESPAVVATEIRLGRCLDLGDTVFTDLLREAYAATVVDYERNGFKMPKNVGKEQKLRKLDRVIIDGVTNLSDERGYVYQTVRCPFEEGSNVYDGGMIKTQSHVQIAVRDRACISSRIFLVDPGAKS